MGMTQVKLTIKNPKDPSIEASKKFLVDSGSFYTVVPEDMVKKLQLEPQITREFNLATGKTVKRKIGGAIVKYGDEEVYTTIVLGKKGDYPLMGALALESFGYALDPFNREIYKANLTL